MRRVHGNERVQRRLTGVNNTLMLPNELAGIIREVCEETGHSCDVLIKVRPAENDFLNPGDSIRSSGYVDFVVEVQEVGRISDDAAHGLYRVNGRFQNRKVQNRR